MIQLEHVNLVVKNIEHSLAFYRAAFPHWWVREEGRGEWCGKQRNWLHFGDDYQYLVFGDNGEEENRDLGGHQVGLAHIAFVTSNLDALVSRVTAAGFPIANSGAEDLHRENSYFIDADGFEVEFVEYISDLPAQRNLAG
jgi:catechol 2,3-dioxygenase-like lactoylglutathione lyase family enzyme